LRRLPLALAFALAGAALACGSTSRPATAENAAILQVDCKVPDAMVWIDDHAVGEVSEMPRGVRVRPGEHRVEVRHDRYHTRYFLLTLRRGEAHALHVTMAELLE
jgi:hypothetical protein